MDVIRLASRRFGPGAGLEPAPARPDGAASTARPASAKVSRSSMASSSGLHWRSLRQTQSLAAGHPPAGILSHPLQFSLLTLN
ncbi:MAG: hypothetical protein ABSB41_17125 [Anaerolineales bacterium]